MSEMRKDEENPTVSEGLVVQGQAVSGDAVRNDARDASWYWPEDDEFNFGDSFDTNSPILGEPESVEDETA